MRSSLFCAAAVLSLILTGRAIAGQCQGKPLDDYSGGDGVVRWRARAVRQAQTEKFCYERTVTVGKRTFVTWPKANIRNTLVETRLAVYACCYAGPRPEKDILIYGIDPVRIGTTLYTGAGEAVGLAAVPISSTSWVSIEGDPVLDGKILKLSLTLHVERLAEYDNLTWVNDGQEDVEVRLSSHARELERLVIKAGNRVSIKNSISSRDRDRRAILTALVGALLGATSKNENSALAGSLLGASPGLAISGISLRRTNGTDSLTLIDLDLKRE